MARQLPSAVENAFDQNGIALGLLVQFVFPEGVYGLWSGQGTLGINGQSYKGIDRIIGFSGYSDTAGNQSEGSALTLSQIPSDKLPDAWFEDLEALTYDNAPCIVSWVGFDVETHENLGLLKTTNYEIDTVSYATSEQDDAGAYDVSVEISLETPNRNLNSSNSVRRSDADQRFHNNPDDTGMRNAVVGNRFKLEFGRING